MRLAATTRLITALLAGSLLFGEARAQSAPSDWEGLYLGDIVGVAWSEFDITSPAMTSSGSSTAITGGAFHGYNVLLGANMLAGIESDIVFSDLGGDLSFGRHRTSWVGRLGAFLTPRVLLYGLGGLAGGKFRAELTTAGSTTTTTMTILVDDEVPVTVTTTTMTPGMRGEASKRLWGYTVGGGLEAEVDAFGQTMRLGAEYRYSDFGDWTPVLAGTPFRIDTEIHEFRSRLIVPFGQAN